jgi:protein-disulfide isomerase
MHDSIFAIEELSEASLRAVVGAAGVHIAELDSCMQSEESEAQVRKDVLVGRMAGVTATPAFFVNGELVPASGLESAVERVLGGAR